MYKRSNSTFTSQLISVAARKHSSNAVEYRKITTFFSKKKNCNSQNRSDAIEFAFEKRSSFFLPRFSFQFSYQCWWWRRIQHKTDTYGRQHACNGPTADDVSNQSTRNTLLMEVLPAHKFLKLLVCIYSDRFFPSFAYRHKLFSSLQQKKHAQNNLDFVEQPEVHFNINLFALLNIEFNFSVRLNPSPRSTEPKVLLRWWL